MINRRIVVLASCAVFLTGCELRELLEDKVALRKEAEGKAVGAACRHAGRAIESCYSNNAKVSKAAIFAGWREMDTYMRENNIQVVLPESPPGEGQDEEADKKSADAEGAKHDGEGAKKSADIKKPAAPAGGTTAQRRSSATSV
jgi:hypothetical protein